MAIDLIIPGAASVGFAQSSVEKSALLLVARRFQTHMEGVSLALAFRTVAAGSRLFSNSNSVRMRLSLFEFENAARWRASSPYTTASR